MDQLHADALELQKSLNDALTRIGIDKLELRKAEIDKEADDPNLWQDNEHAQKVKREQASLDARLNPWRDIQSRLKTVLELLELNDESIESDIGKDLEDVKESFEVQK
jgi:peptide chain release factor 2